LPTDGVPERSVEQRTDSTAHAFVVEVLLDRYREREADGRDGGRYVDAVFELLPELVIPFVQCLTRSHDEMERLMAPAYLGHALEAAPREALVLCREWLAEEDLRNSARDSISFFAEGSATDPTLAAALNALLKDR
jgi:hypothetical protein